MLNISQAVKDAIFMTAYIIVLVYVREDNEL